MNAEGWIEVGAIADIVLAGVALYVTALHLTAHAHDKRQQNAQSEDTRERHKLSAETFRKYASLSTRPKLAIIALATLAKIAASVAKLV
jgi:hypothetical protein